MKKTNIIKAFLLVFVLALLQSCIVAIPNRFNERYAKRHEDIKCITAAQLKDTIISDTSHYKVVMIYSAGCGPCSLHLNLTYAPAYAKQREDVKFYFISESTGGIRHCRKELERNGLYNGKVLCLYDNNPAFYNKRGNEDSNIQTLNNLANYIFTNGPEVTGNFGLPCEYIISKDNRVLKQLVTTPTSGSAIATMPLHQIDIDSIHLIDFDSIYQLTLDYDLYDLLKECTGDQCPVLPK